MFGGSLNWSLIGLGALIGAAVIVVDEVLGRSTRHFHLPPLAVGMGMYLPNSLTLLITVGAVIGWGYDRWAARSGGNVERKRRMGVLLATGLIVGEGLYGVVFAGIVAATGKEEPLGIVGDGFGNWAQLLGTIVFVLVVAGLYRFVSRISAAGRPARR